MEGVSTATMLCNSVPLPWAEEMTHFRNPQKRNLQLQCSVRQHAEQAPKQKDVLKTCETHRRLIHRTDLSENWSTDPPL